MLDATNDADSERLLGVFAPDAVVEDWKRKFEGRDQIARWNDDENIGAGARIEPVGVERSAGEVRVQVEVAGDGYNGGGAFVFELAGDQIQRLEIRG